jgi:hypothetical protein
MTQRQTFALLCGTLAVAAAVVFFAISTDHAVYAPGARDIHWWFLDHLRDSSPRYHHELNIFFLVRKAYSIVAFSILGLLVAPIIPKPNRILVAALVVGTFSTIIEIGQKLTGTIESIYSNLFDVGCGVLGGAIGALAWNLWRAIARRSADR